MQISIEIAKPTIKLSGVGVTSLLHILGHAGGGGEDKEVAT